VTENLPISSITFKARELRLLHDYIYSVHSGLGLHKTWSPCRGSGVFITFPLTLFQRLSSRRNWSFNNDFASYVIVYLQILQHQLDTTAQKNCQHSYTTDFTIIYNNFAFGSPFYFQFTAVKSVISILQNLQFCVQF
jgi:hypothetical protein